MSSGKETRSRASRRGARKGRGEAQQVQAAVELEAVSTEEGSGGAKAAVDLPKNLAGTADKVPEQTGLLPTIDEEKGLVTDPATDVVMTKASRSILHALPTPSRGRASQQAAADPAPGASTGRTGAKGPEPWNLGSAVSAPVSRGGYRELLQLRGQQAMQRSLKQGISRPSAQAAAGVATPLAQVQASSLQQGSWANPAAVAAAGGLQMQPWLAAQAAVGAQPTQMLPGCGQQLPLLFGPSPGTPVAGQSPVAFGCQPMLSPTVEQQQQHIVFGTCQQASGTPMSNQTSPIAFSDCSQNSTPVAGQQQLMGFADCSQGVTPVANQQLVSFGTDCQQGTTSPAVAMNGGSIEVQTTAAPQELIAALMPGAACFNNDQIAEQLKAAVPCCYDD